MAAIDKELKEKAWKLSKDHVFSTPFFIQRLKVREEVAIKLYEYVVQRNLDEAQAKMNFRFTKDDDFPDPDKPVLAVCGKSSHGPQFISLRWNKHRGWHSEDESLKHIRFDHITCWCQEPKPPEDWYKYE